VPAWRRFVREGAVDFLLLSLGILIGRLVASNLSPSSGFWQHAAISVGTVAFPVSIYLYYRGVYRSYARYIGLYDFLNIATAGIPVLLLTALVDTFTVKAPQWDHALLSALISVGFLPAYRFIKPTGPWGMLNRIPPTV